MKHRPDAYEMEFSNRGGNVCKCDHCGFKAVKCQFDEEGGCPSCKLKYDKTKNADNKEREINKGHMKIKE